MARLIAAVVVGYLVMAFTVFASFSAAYLALGADATFQPGTYEPSALWIGVSFVLGFIAAILGGWVCAAIARDPKGPKTLVAIVVVLGLLMAIPSLTRQVERKPRLGPVSNMEAMQSAQTPAWVALLNPLLGAAGVVVGSRLRKRQP